MSTFTACARVLLLGAALCLAVLLPASPTSSASAQLTATDTSTTATVEAAFDHEAFKTAHLLDTDTATEMADSLSLTSNDGEVAVGESAPTIIDGGPEDQQGGSFIPIPLPIRCKDGPIRHILYEPGYFYFPHIFVRRCKSLPCPNSSPCLARRTVMRNVWTIVYKRFNCWGLWLYFPIGIRQFCVVDELDCECKKCSDIASFRECVTTQPCPDETNTDTLCYWRPCKMPPRAELESYSVFNVNATASEISSWINPRLWGACDCCKVQKCPANQYFDRRTCQCRCVWRYCHPPEVFDPETCSCVCPLTYDCVYPHLKWNPRTCKCECKPFFCFTPRVFNKKTCDCECPKKKCYPPFRPDPASCECKCPKDIVCRPPYVLNQKNCKCECPPILCAPYFTLDPDTCKCVCNRTCLPGQALNRDRCQCECRPIHCPPGQIQNKDTCKCECEPIYCPPGQIQNSKTCKCECEPVNCPPHFVQDPDTCECVCKRECPTGQVLNEKCECECIPILCRPYFVQDPNTCRCVCNRTCPSHQVLNKDTCECECRLIYCPPGQVQNKDTCECECEPIYCPPGKKQDPDTCKCVCERGCPTGQIQDEDTCECRCPEVKCPPHHVQDPYTCQCVCKRICLAGSTLDPDTCKCFGFCAEIFDQKTCENTDSCLLNRDKKCRWFKDHPKGPCACECCQPSYPTSASLSTDCGAHSIFGQTRCNSVYGCTWTC